MGKRIISFISHRESTMANIHHGHVVKIRIRYEAIPIVKNPGI